MRRHRPKPGRTFVIVFALLVALAGISTLTEKLFIPHHSLRKLVARSAGATLLEEGSEKVGSITPDSKSRANAANPSVFSFMMQKTNAPLFKSTARMKKLDFYPTSHYTIAAYHMSSLLASPL